jgi:hypothetical protein
MDGSCSRVDLPTRPDALFKKDVCLVVNNTNFDHLSRRVEAGSFRVKIDGIGFKQSTGFLDDASAMRGVHDDLIRSYTF